MVAVPSGRHNDGYFMAVFKVDAFRPLASFKRDVADLAHYLKQTPLAEGSNAIYYPGELEHTCAVQRERDGIAVEDSTRAKLAPTGWCAKHLDCSQYCFAIKVSSY